MMHWVEKLAAHKIPLRHDFGVDAKEVRLVVQNDLSDLKKKIARIIVEIEKTK